MEFCPVCIYQFVVYTIQAPPPLVQQQGAPERWRLVKAHGTAVGLPSDDDMGNSEVGHNAPGAGRIFAQGYAIYFQFILGI
jgi:2,3-bisphosphoglycerate-independent phosphoglycerate mutase